MGISINGFPRFLSRPSFSWFLVRWNSRGVPHPVSTTGLGANLLSWHRKTRMARITALASVLLCLNGAMATHHHAPIHVRPSKTVVEAPNITLRIYGGTDASEGEFPWFVHGDGCGASLVAKDVVLTAAHCQNSFFTSVRVGPQHHHDGGETVRVDRRQEIIHPSFSSTTMAYDIMLVKLGKEVNVNPVPLNFDHTYPAEDSNEVLTVMGFGASNKAVPSEYLEKVDVLYYNHATCAQRYGTFRIDRDLMMCAGSEQGGKDSCQGDR